MNFDFDYFFLSHDSEYVAAFSEQYVSRIFGKLKRAYDAGYIEVLTIALSPETCGGWESAEGLVQTFAATFDLDFRYQRR